MAATSSRTSKKEDTQTRSNAIKPNPHALPSSGRFKDAVNRVMAASTRRSSTGMQYRHAPPSLHPSESRSSDPIKARRNSISDVVAHATSGANRIGRKNNGNSRSINPHTGSPNSDSGLQGKLVSGDLARTSSKASARRVPVPAARADVRVAGRDAASQRRTNELCKDCRSHISRMESICFITNDGKISAASTAALHARHSHHCNVRECAISQSHPQPPSASSLRRDSLATRRLQAPLNPQPTRRKSLRSLSGTGQTDQRSKTSSVQGDDSKRQQETESTVWGSAEISSTSGSDSLGMKKKIDLKAELMMKSSEDHDAESCMTTSSSCRMPIDQNSWLDAVSPCKESSTSSCSPMPHVPTDQESYVDSTHMENVEARISSPAASSILSDIHGDDHDDEKGSPYRDEMQALDDFQGLNNYHGDNEYSCSEGGTDVTTTPISSSKGAFDDVSNNIDIEQLHSENGMSRPRRSAIARMTQKYLDSLTEQEAEKVRLRKKEALARKQAGDWMLDCHMEEVLHRLAPTGEAHVKVLVEAFETVMNQSDSDCSQTAQHLDHEHTKNLCHTKASS